MSITIFLVFLWTLVGGAFAIVDSDSGTHRAGPRVLWLVLYGPCLWLLVVFVVVTESLTCIAEWAKRKLRG